MIDIDTILENEFLTVKSTSKGAEIISIKGKKDDTEYIWTGDADFWGRHAPILFPIVGKLKNNAYKIDDLTYNMSQHGFARNSHFDILEKSQEKIVYRLTYSEETLKIYPYKFELTVQYNLKGNTLEVIYKVKNIDNSEIYFSLGAHPGFNCPLNFEDYYLELDVKEIAYASRINKEDLQEKHKELILDNSSIMPISRELFKEGVLIFNNLKSHKISIKNYKNSKYVSLEFDKFPYFGVWTKDNAPFLCLEPWFGHADYEDFNGDFREKDGILKLIKVEEFSCKYCISIHQ